MKKIGLGQSIAILANVGVIAGIVFLGYELRQNNALLRAEAGYNLLQNRTQFRNSVLTDPALAEFWVGTGLYGDISPIELMVRYRNERILLNWQWEWGQWDEGNLAEGEFSIDTIRAQMSGERSNDFVIRDTWEQFKGELRYDFVEWMENNVVD